MVLSNEQGSQDIDFVVWFKCSWGPSARLWLVGSLAMMSFL
jgi:hypothetical protein